MKKRIKINAPVTVYHVFTRYLDELFLQIRKEDKEYFLKLLDTLSKGFFIEITNFKLMDSHVHIIIKIIKPPPDISEEELKARFKTLYPRKRYNPQKREEYIKNWTDLSFIVKTINERFAMYYNRVHNRRGHFWASRFNSVYLADQDAILNCMAYIDLNAYRAGMVDSLNNIDLAHYITY